jgi:hypothetical protein
MGFIEALILTVIAVIAAVLPETVWIRQRRRLYAKGSVPERALTPAVVVTAESRGRARVISE